MLYIKSTRKKINTDRLFGYLLLSPTLLLIIFFILAPLLVNVFMSLTDQEFFSIKYKFVGIYNYLKIFADVDFSKSLLRSFFWVFGNMLIQVILSFFFALILNKSRGGRSLMTILVMLPWFTPTIIITVMWKWMLNSSFGVINYLMLALNLSKSPINFLGDPSTAFYSLIIINSWQWFPFFCVLILAALQMIPLELEEAARVDGANNLKQFYYIKMPFIQPTLSTVGLIAMLMGFNIFDSIWFLTKGGPGRVSTTMPVYIYETGFKAFKLGMASAQSTVVMLILMGLVAIYLRAFRPFREESVMT